MTREGEFAAALAARLIAECEGLCAVYLPSSEDGRCIAETVAMRWEHGFIDPVCLAHAQDARERGCLVLP